MAQDVCFFVGSDHGGVSLRDALVEHLRARGVTVADVSGPARADIAEDYPDVAVSVCHRVLLQPPSLGLLVCGTGQGMAMTANRIAGIRAGVVSDSFSAMMIREHNDANVLCLGQRVLGIEVAKLLVDAFADARFAGGRHQRRVDKMVALDRPPAGAVGG